jgi:beta-lactamase regulating signal transducer with metallopeptidase domain
MLIYHYAISEHKMRKQSFTAKESSSRLNTQKGTVNNQVVFTQVVEAIVYLYLPLFIYIFLLTIVSIYRRAERKLKTDEIRRKYGKR